MFMIDGIMVKSVKQIFDKWFQKADDRYIDPQTGTEIRIHGRDIVIGKGVKFGHGVTLGNYIIIDDHCDIGNDVKIGDDTQICHKCIIEDNCMICGSCYIAPLSHLCTPSLLGGNFQIRSDK